MISDWGEIPVATEPRAFKVRYGATIYPDIYMRAPNRYRKLLIDTEIPKSDRDPWGMDFSPIQKSDEAIEMQKTDFPLVPGVPIGFQPLMDNDLAIAWILG